MKKFLVSLLVGILVVVFCGSFFGVYADTEITNSFKIIQEEKDGATTTRINNIKNRATTYALNSVADPLTKFAQEHPQLDLKIARNSNYVVYQEQIIMPTSDTWEDDDGYMKIVTTAYHRGYTPSGNARYYVKGDVIFYDEFNIRNQDQLILNHSSNGVFDSTGTENGMMMYHESLHNHSAYVNPPIDSEEDITFAISPDYTNAFGVCFKFEWPEDLIQNNGFFGPAKVDIRNVYTEWAVMGGYHVIATNDTNVAVSYVHNKNITGLNLSLSFGAYGISANIQVPQGEYEPYYARPILIYNI